MDFQTGVFLKGNTEHVIHSMEYIVPIPRFHADVYIEMIGVLKNLADYINSSPLMSYLLLDDEGYLMRKKRLDELKREYDFSVQYFMNKSSRV